jgi:hypothetical protein
MLVSFIFIIASIFGLYSYQTRKYSNFVISLFFILTSGFGFVATPEEIRLTDIALFMCLSIAFSNFIRDGKFFSAKNDSIAKIIYVLLGYYTIIAILTVLLERDSFLYSFKIWRLELFYLAYFTFRKIPISETEKAFKFILVMTVIAMFFFILQFIGLTGILYQDAGDELFSRTDKGRFRNLPFLAAPLIFYLLYYNGQLKYRNVFLFLFIAAVILAQSRGLMIGILISIVIYQLLIRKFSKLAQKLVLLGVFAVLFLPILQHRFVSKEGSGQDIGFFEEINKGFSLSTDFTKYDRTDIEGNFSFRMFLITERIQYLFSHPEYLLSGVGTIHENSPYNRLDFVIGSVKVDDSGDLIVQQLDTNDISFAAHLLRYGFLYFIIFIYFMCSSIKRLYQSRKLSVMTIAAFLLMVEISIQSLSTDQFSGFALMAFPLLILAQSNLQSKKRILPSITNNIQ